MTTTIFRNGGGITDLRHEAIAYSLRRSEIFSGLPEQDLREMAETAVIRSLDEGAYLFHKDEMAPGLYLVRRGLINFHRVASDGREIVIHFYREGEILAEIGGEKEAGGCPADARAVLPSEVIVVPRRRFLVALHRCPELALRLFSVIDLQVHQLADSLEDIVSRDAVDRFVQWLLRRCGEGKDAVEISLGTTKRVLASELGVRQETLSRTLRRLSDEGYLCVNGRRITIKNPRALRGKWATRIGRPAAA